MDPVTIMAGLATMAAIGTSIKGVKESLWDPYVWPLSKIILILMVSGATVSVVTTNLRIIEQSKKGA